MHAFKFARPSRLTLFSCVEIKKAVNQAQLTYDIVNKNWEVFCLVIRLLFHKRLLPSQEAIDGQRDKDAQEAAALSQAEVSIDKEQTGIRRDEPKKVFNPRKLVLIKQAYVLHMSLYWILFFFVLQITSHRQ